MLHAGGKAELVQVCAARDCTQMNAAQKKKKSKSITR
jgi:hypothetical protein